jgi:GNAT superfamily N-acetyltransferase
MTAMASDGSSAMHIRPVTPDLWPSLEDLFGRQGASSGCWCMYWRIGPAYSRRPRSENRDAFRALVEEGPPPGLIAFSGDRPVGWCQLTPRTDLLWLDRGPRAPRIDDTPVWSISCFYVRGSHRRQGVALALIQEAVRVARRRGIAVLEAYPIDLDAPRGTTNPFTGMASSFRKAGFVEVARQPPARVIMRLDVSPPDDGDISGPKGEAIPRG